MSTFPLKIVSPEGLMFDGEARQLTLRTGLGEMTVLARHAPFAAALAGGRATMVDAQGNRRQAACRGGMIAILEGRVTVVSDHFTWAEDAAETE